VSGGQSRGVRPQLRRAIWLGAKRRCQACRKAIPLSDAHIHHIKNVAGGGCDTRDNLACLCVRCHVVTQCWGVYKSYWYPYPCGCRVQVYRWFVVPTKRVCHYFESIGVRLDLHRPSKKRLKELCPAHARTYPASQEPSWHWEGRREGCVRVCTERFTVYCKPLACDQVAKYKRKYWQIDRNAARRRGRART
jgi:hypothetical protein